LKVDRYAVYWVNLDPVLGAEIAKTRPAAVISDEAMNERLGTVVVCPITSRIHSSWPSRVQTMVNGKPAEIAVDQIRTIAKSRIGERLDMLDSGVAASVRHVITEMYGVLSVSGFE
jgi:mRNA interferase MazF